MRWDIGVARRKAEGRSPGPRWPIAATTDPDSAEFILMVLQGCPPKGTSFGAHPGYGCAMHWDIAVARRKAARPESGAAVANCDDRPGFRGVYPDGVAGLPPKGTSFGAHPGYGCAMHWDIAVVRRKAARPESGAAVANCNDRPGFRPAACGLPPKGTSFGAHPGYGCRGVTGCSPDATRPEGSPLGGRPEGSHLGWQRNPGKGRFCKKIE
jgi:hypothetical protein